LFLLARNSFARVYIWSYDFIYEETMAATLTSIRLDKELADEAAEELGVKTRTEAVQKALEEVVALKRFKKLMLDYGGKGSFSGLDE
jgi:Arc/MetJ family transcription regulator